MNELTARQATAIQFPCWRATEAAQPRYFRDHGNNWRTLLTINR